jgi:hypothetical protein
MAAVEAMKTAECSADSTSRQYAAEAERCAALTQQVQQLSTELEAAKADQVELTRQVGVLQARPHPQSEEAHILSLPAMAIAPPPAPVAIAALHAARPPRPAAYSPAPLVRPMQLPPTSIPTPTPDGAAAMPAVVGPRAPQPGGLPQASVRPARPTVQMASSGDGMVSAAPAASRPSRPTAPAGNVAVLSGVARPGRPASTEMPAAVLPIPGAARPGRPGAAPASGPAGGGLAALFAARPGRPLGIPRAESAPPSSVATDTNDGYVPMRSKKPLAKPGCKMKNLFWTKLPDSAIDRTIFKDLTDEKVSSCIVTK